MGLLPLPSVFFADELVRLPVRVTRDRETVRTLFDEPVKFGAILQFGERDVHHQNDELFLRHESEVVFHKSELPLVEPARVGEFALLVSAPPLDVIEDDEVDGAMIKAVVVRTEVPVVGLVRINVVGRFEIEIVISDHVVPGDPDEGDIRVRGFKQLELVEHDVAEGHAEGGIRPHQFGDDIVGDVVDLLNR